MTRMLSFLLPLLLTYFLLPSPHCALLPSHTLVPIEPQFAMNFRKLRARAAKQNQNEPFQALEFFNRAAAKRTGVGAGKWRTLGIVSISVFEPAHAAYNRASAGNFFSRSRAGGFGGGAVTNSPAYKRARGYEVAAIISSEGHGMSPDPPDELTAGVERLTNINKDMTEL
ncbi:hypothetical protein EVAR_62016_1 [Eumeta japonica]|uniref:Uncharacterized protein n=1 Tax=Eumeta variegata TaxID=151549 RepID=A0A4C1ZZ14_EUMVA|nr:hypothetical protein EVAR_62016_1 [Eumeta japonica]